MRLHHLTRSTHLPEPSQTVRDSSRTWCLSPRLAKHDLKDGGLETLFHKSIPLRGILMGCVLAQCFDRRQRSVHRGGKTGRRRDEEDWKSYIMPDLQCLCCVFHSFLFRQVDPSFPAIGEYCCILMFAFLFPRIVQLRRKSSSPERPGETCFDRRGPACFVNRYETCMKLKNRLLIEDLSESGHGAYDRLDR